MATDRDAVLIIGGSGEFGQFLRHDILPSLGTQKVLTVEHDTPRKQQLILLAQARHIVLSTPLASYAEQACELVYQCRAAQTPTTLWLIASVQAGVWRAVSATLSMVENPYLSAVFAHPMYGPHGFRETEPEARTFRNILTAIHDGAEHPLAGEIARSADTFRCSFNIETTAVHNPEEHDRITAYSQGLSYCVARLMFERPEFEQQVQKQMPDLRHSFRANHDLIIDFLRINAYMPQVIAAFEDAQGRIGGTTYADVLQAFALADVMLNGGFPSPIPTKWYEKLRVAAEQSRITKDD